MSEIAADGERGSQTLERGLAVLSEIARAVDGLTTAQVAASLDLHRSIAYRLLVSLQRTGFAVRGERGRYVLGPAFAELSRAAQPSLRAVAEPVLHQLARTVDATASLVEVNGEAALTTVVAEPPTDGPRFSYRLGNRDPLDRGAGGLAALASLPVGTSESERVAQARTAGYIQTFGELNPGAYGLAAPLPGWGVPAAINIVSSRPSLMEEALEPLLAAVRQITCQAR